MKTSNKDMDIGIARLGLNIMSHTCTLHQNVNYSHPPLAGFVLE